MNILQLPKQKLNIKHIPKRINKIINNYKDDVFSNRIGKFEDVKVQLHINKNVFPVAQPERRIPFALHEKVRNEIKNLEVNDIVTNEI